MSEESETLKAAKLAIPDELNPAFDRIASDHSTEADVEAVRQFLSTHNAEVLQVGKYNINVGQGQNIQIGDRIYQGTDAETLREVIQAILQENQILPGQGKPPHIWRYLHTLRGHSGAVNAVVMSPNDQTLVSAGSDRTIKLWHLGSMQILHDFPKGKTSVEALAISPNGQTLASGSKGGTVKIWNLTTNALHYTLSGIHAGKVTSLTISPNGQILITASTDRTIKVWHLPTGNAVRTLEAGQTPLMAIALSHDGQRLVSGSEGGTLRLWNLATGELHQPPIHAHAGSINAIVISPDAQTLVTASSDKTIKLWQLQTRSLFYTLDPGQTPVKAMAISQNYGVLVSGSEGGTVKFWDLASQELLYALHGVHFSAISSLTISPDSQLCVTSSTGGNLKIWQKKIRPPVESP